MKQRADKSIYELSIMDFTGTKVRYSNFTTKYKYTHPETNELKNGENLLRKIIKKEKLKIDVNSF